MQPSEKQLNFAKDIAKKLDIVLPQKAFDDQSICSEFIKKHKDSFNQRSNKSTPNPGNDKTTSLKPEKKLANYQLGNTVSDAKEKEVIKYWHEGLVRTAFDSYGNLESELTGVQSFPFDKIDYVLNNFQCKNLQDISKFSEKEGIIRHLVMMLEPTNTDQAERSKNIVLLIFPLVLNSDNDSNKENRKVPYCWQRAGKEIPIFNQKLLGEEAEIEGLMLHNVEGLDKLLLSADTNLSENASVQECLGFLEKCFDVLTEKDYGCTGWIDAFTSIQANYPRLRNKKVRFKWVDGSAVSGATKNIRLCYEELIAAAEFIKSPSLKLFRRLFGHGQANNQDSSQTFAMAQEKQSWEQLSQYLGHMDNRITDNTRSCYPLDPSQRIALTLFKKVKAGNLLAVNGPPGTGKTSLLRAVIADEWIRPLISEEKFPDCPVIIACAATNQAVTNVISSFDSVPGPELFDIEGERSSYPVSLESRWLPHLVSYGWYQPASTGKSSKEYQGFQVISRKSPKQSWEFNFAAKEFGIAEKNLSYLEYCYLTVASEFFNQKETLLTIAEKFRSKVVDSVKQMDDISVLLNDWRLKFNLLINFAKNIREDQNAYNLLKQNFDLQNPIQELTNLSNQITIIQSQLIPLTDAKNELNRKFNPTIYRLFIRSIKQYFFKKDTTYQRDILKKSLHKIGLELPCNQLEFVTSTNFIDAKCKELKDQLSCLQLEREKLVKNTNESKQILEQFEKDKQDYLLLKDQVYQIGKRFSLLLGSLANNECKEISKIIGHTYQAVMQGQDLSFDLMYQSLLDSIQNWLDVNIRPKLFHLTARYWEARYLIYKKSISDDKNHRPGAIERIRALAMLAPVFVTTSYSAPKLMRCADNSRAFNYLYGAAELLIIDEAGQGTSEIGACTFAFAKRAIVVGDTQQLKPVWNVISSVDILIHKKLELSLTLDEMKEKGLLMSTGSIMLMAQSSTAFYDEHREIPGVMLTNHYRCRGPIIEICNEMVYAGGLTVVKATTEPKKEWRPPLAFLVVPGDSTRLISGSRANVQEAEWIAKWLKEQESSILAHYTIEKNLKGLPDLVAILTPFKGQVSYLRKEIAKAFGENINNKDAIANQMVIGTVHSLQGSERPIVIFSMVDTAIPTDNHFYDTDYSLINVAVSRAKEVFIVALDQQSVNYGRSLTRKKINKPSDYLFYHIVNNGQRLNSRRILFIESPNKRAYLEAALTQGMELEIIATNGHLTELDSTLDWDPLSAEEPKWSPLSDKEAQIYERTALLWPDLESVYIATDPDGEGECIAWQFINRVQSFLPLAHHNQPVIKRMRFHNLVSKDIREAFDKASNGLDAGLVKSALFRAILDQILSRHYPLKLGLSKNNSFHAGIGRVQLSILDIANQLTDKPEQYYIEVSLPITELNQFGNFILFHADNSGPIVFSDPLQAKKTAEKLEARLADRTEIKFDWNAVVEQLPEYPAINTANFLALACKTYYLPPWQVMDILQNLYEGQKTTHDENILEQQV